MDNLTLKERINTIDKQISDASDVISRRERSVRRAERNLEIAEDYLAELENQRDELIIASWGEAPNWQGIFGMSEGASSAMRAYREKWISTIPGMRLTSYGNIYTGQSVYGIGFTTKSAAELEQTIRMVEFLMPYLLADQRKEKTLMIYNYPAVDCCHSFIFNTETGKYGIATDRFMSRQDTMEFPSLEDALRHLQENSLFEEEP
ncbi:MULTISPECIES: hypothetical protein [Enterobacteriaceae]|uniref:hypothetical protein n=1 Tax=Enterobacteriaceae TaxID=543 RepID=UPI000E0477B9|nr:hypothetical protein [Citrobacter koseri]MEB2704111.1 hypothetical protein [Citrobacter koseri]MEB2709036.1 hypothetical protein [Citrobacter koseri]STB73263.1 Uncharacterised protein [Citrobacter koseri]STT23444.1 Uncharacterised protein [Citrobacter koseri]